MSSDDEEAQSSLLGARSLNWFPPPIDSESGSSEDALPENRSRIQWRTVLKCATGDDAIMGENQMKLLITQAHTKIMKGREWSSCLGMFLDRQMWACGN
jgi:hypothetical protein